MGTPDYLSVLLATFIVDVAFFVVQFFDLKINILKFRLGRILRFYKPGLDVVIFSYSKFVFGGGSKLAIFHVFGSVYAGTYALSWQIITMTSIIFSQLVKVWRNEITEMLSNGDNKGAFDRFNYMICIYLFMSVIIALAVFISMGFITEHYGDSFSNIEAFLFAILFYVPVTGFDYALSVISIATNQTHTLRSVYVRAFFVTSSVYLLLFLFNQAGLYDSSPVYIVYSMTICHSFTLLFVYLKIKNCS